ncbi:MAG: hypothetical protein L3J23_09480 [Flavobacteriaceae bacterium]|nr:hypothetical protein [Flavobacteriaceae bacterium]
MTTFVHRINLTVLKSISTQEDKTNEKSEIDYSKYISVRKSDYKNIQKLLELNAGIL